MPHKSLRIACLQMDLQWHDPAVNRQEAERLLAEIHGPLDLLLLPEMFATGFTMEAKSVAEKMDGESLQWMQSVAKRYDCAVGGSLVIEDQGSFVNRFCWVNESGCFAQYDKRHLFSLAGEDKPYEAGQKRSIIEWRGWKISTQICYDLRFPVWARNQFDEEGVAAYDLLVNVANWPKPRITHWDALLSARAIENLSYVVGVNRVGTDENGFEYCGSSRVIGYDGEVLASARNQSTVVLSVLDLDPLMRYRQKFPFWKEAD